MATYSCTTNNLRGVEEYFTTLQIRQVDNKIDLSDIREQMFEQNGNDKTNISYSAYLCKKIEFLPTYIYNANGEIEVWRNTLLRLVVSGFTCSTR